MAWSLAIRILQARQQGIELSDGSPGCVGRAREHALVREYVVVFAAITSV
jgi:hypothetical protein